MKILVCAPDAWPIQIMQRTVERLGHQMTAVASEEDAWNVFQEKDPPSIAIVDFENASLAQRIRESALTNSTYVIALLPEGRDLEPATEADDQLVWPLDEYKLEVNLRVACRIVETQRTLMRKAITDPLTGVWNHSAIIHTLQRELARAKRSGRTVAILMLDLDRFKTVNDTFGHLAGDFVLRECVRRMQPIMRVYDVLGRYGGEEFLIVLPDCNSARALKVADRMKACIADAPIGLGAHQIPVTASIGIAVSTGAGINCELLIELADQALYRAKTNGRNRAELSASCASADGDSGLTPELIGERLKAEIEERKRTESALKKAEERVRLLAKATSDAVWDWNLITNEVWWNEGLKTMLGYSEVGVGADWWAQKIHVDDVERVMTSIDRVFQSQAEFWSGEYRYQRADGTYAYIFDRGYVLYDETGKAVRMIGAMIDLTQQKSIEKELSEAQARYRALVENLPAIVYTVSCEPSSTWLYVSPQIKPVLGYSPEEWISSPAIHAGCIDPRDRAAVQNEQVRSFQNGTPRICEYRMQSRDGQIRWIRDQASPVVDSAGNILYFQGIMLDVTEQKQAEEALKENENWFQSLSAVSPVGIFRTDKSGNCVYVNQRWCDLSGLSPEKAYGSGWKQAIHPDDRARVAEAWELAIKKKSPFMCEYRFQRPDGSFSWLIGQSAHVSDQTGEVLGYIGTITDITERKQSELVQSALHRISEAAIFSTDMQQLYATIHSIVGELMYAQNFYISIYDAATNMLSFPYWADEEDPPPDPVRAGKGLTAYVIRTRQTLLSTMEDWDEFQKTNEVELVGGYSVDWLGAPLIAGDEIFGVIVVQSYNQNIRFGEKDKELLTFVSQHVAAALRRKSREAALRESEEKYRTLFLECKDPIFINSPDGAIIDINPAGLQMFGFSSLDEIASYKAQDLYANPDERNAYRELLEKNGYVKDYDIVVKRKDGQKLIVQETSSVVRNRDGIPVAYRGMLRDITHVKLLQEQLIQSQKMETVGRLAGGIAHDFNNVLMAISGYCELIDLQYQHDHALKLYVNEIIRATQRGAALTGQLLAFTRKQIVTLQSIDLNHILTNMKGVIERLKGNQTRLTFQLQPDPALIKGDPFQVEQIITNLVVNAREAMPSGGMLTIETINITLEAGTLPAYPHQRPGQFLMLRVSDNGMGMDEITKARIFEPFFSTKETGKGAGLGLTTVYAIVEQMGGHISVFSEPAHGTTFMILFPKFDSPVEVKVNKAVTNELTTGREVILVVDDNEAVLSAIGSSLSLYGYQVLRAPGGEEAIKTSRKYDGKIDLLLTDIVMPKMNGRELARRLLAERPGLKILYMSGYTDETVFHQGRLDPGTDVLQKPASTKLLLAKIRNLLG